jgi:hypothetical protein
MSPVPTCSIGCPYGHRVDFDGYCIKGCPEGHVVDEETGRCKYEDYFNDIIVKFSVSIIPISVIFVLLVGLSYYIKDKKRKNLYPIEHELAIVLSRIHQMSQVKTLRDKKPVFVGVGKNPENLNEWVNEIWNMYVVDVKHPGMSG